MKTNKNTFLSLYPLTYHLIKDTVTNLEEIKVFQRDTVSLNLTITIDAMDPKEMEMSPRISSWEKGKGPARGRSCIPQTDFRL